MSADQSPEEHPVAESRRYSPEETARLGDAIYERSIRVRVEPQHEGEVVAIDVETGAHALGTDALTAARRLRDRRPDAEVWLLRIGSRSLYRIGAYAGLANP